MLLRGFHALASYVLRDGGAKALQRAEHHFNAAMQLAVSFIWDRKIGPRCSKRGVQLQFFSALLLNHLEICMDFGTPAISGQVLWTWEGITGEQSPPVGVSRDPSSLFRLLGFIHRWKVNTKSQSLNKLSARGMIAHHRLVLILAKRCSVHIAGSTKQPCNLFVRRNTKMFLHFVKKTWISNSDVFKWVAVYDVVSFSPISEKTDHICKYPAVKAECQQLSKQKGSSLEFLPSQKEVLTLQFSALKSSVAGVDACSPAQTHRWRAMAYPVATGCPTIARHHLRGFWKAL